MNSCVGEQHTVTTQSFWRRPEDQIVVLSINVSTAKTTSWWSCKLSEEWHRNHRHWARTRWETYLWWVERVGFWDFDFKMISATFKNKVKGWQLVIKQIKCQATVVQVIEGTFIRCIWRASYLPPEICEVVTHHLNFDLVFTCLWVWINEKDAMRNILFFLFHGGMTCQIWNNKRLVADTHKWETRGMFRTTSTFTFNYRQSCFSLMVFTGSFKLQNIC